MYTQITFGKEAQGDTSPHEVPEDAKIIYLRGESQYDYVDSPNCLQNQNLFIQIGSYQPFQMVLLSSCTYLKMYVEQIIWIVDFSLSLIKRLWSLKGLGRDLMPDDRGPVVVSNDLTLMAAWWSSYLNEVDVYTG